MSFCKSAETGSVKTWLHSSQPPLNEVKKSKLRIQHTRSSSPPPPTCQRKRKDQEVRSSLLSLNLRGFSVRRFGMHACGQRKEGTSYGSSRERGEMVKEGEVFGPPLLLHRDSVSLFGSNGRVWDIDSSLSLPLHENKRDRTVFSSRAHMQKVRLFLSVFPFMQKAISTFWHPVKNDMVDGLRSIWQ